MLTPDIRTSGTPLGSGRAINVERTMAEVKGTRRQRVSAEQIKRVRH